MPGRQRLPADPVAIGSFVPSTFYPVEVFPTGTPNVEFAKNRSSHDEAGTSGGDVTIVQIYVH
jgi:hypothetical protein